MLKIDLIGVTRGSSFDSMFIPSRVAVASRLLVSHLLSLLILSLGVLVGLVVPIGGTVGRGSSILSGGGTISTLNSGSRLSNAKEVDSKEGEDTQKDGLRDQVDGVAGAGEVQSALSLLRHFLGLGGHGRTGEEHEAKGSYGFVHFVICLL